MLQCSAHHQAQIYSKGHTTADNTCSASHQQRHARLDRSAPLTNIHRSYITICCGSHSRIFLLCKRCPVELHSLLQQLCTLRRLHKLRPGAQRIGGIHAGIRPQPACCCIVSCWLGYLSMLVGAHRTRAGNKGM
jgi:hypothetical protein